VPFGPKQRPLHGRTMREGHLWNRSLIGKRKSGSTCIHAHCCWVVIAAVAVDNNIIVAAKRKQKR
jgi:hypothetical protein